MGFPAPAAPVEAAPAPAAPYQSGFGEVELASTSSGYLDSMNIGEEVSGPGLLAFKDSLQAASALPGGAGLNAYKDTLAADSALLEEPVLTLTSVPSAPATSTVCPSLLTEKLPLFPSLDPLPPMVFRSPSKPETSLDLLTDLVLVELFD